MQLTLGVDNSLVAVYNDENGTEYETVDPSLVKMEPIQCAENQVFSPDATITLDPKSIEKGYYFDSGGDQSYFGCRICRQGGLRTLYLRYEGRDGCRNRRDDARRLEDRPDLGMDDHLLSGYCDERRHRCLELRLRRAESGHVRRPSSTPTAGMQTALPIRGATAATSPSTWAKSTT